MSVSDTHQVYKPSLIQYRYGAGRKFSWPLCAKFGLRLHLPVSFRPSRLGQGVAGRPCQLIKTAAVHTVGIHCPGVESCEAIKTSIAGGPNTCSQFEHLASRAPHNTDAKLTSDNRASNFPANL